jgi:hypothetical protein
MNFMKRKLMLLLVCLTVGVGLATAQNRRVTGHVTSEEDGQPVIGASILVKGTTMGTITDVDGNFTLSNVPQTAKIIQVSYIGMQTLEVGIKSTMNIQLKVDAQVIDEVVVTGMQRMDKRLFTGATSKLAADDVKLDGLPEISPCSWKDVACVSLRT